MEVKAMDELPDYMKVCYLALINTTNEVAYEVLKEQGINATPYLTKAVIKNTSTYYSLIKNIFETCMHI